jgi:hypothetical protein
MSFCQMVVVEVPGRSCCRKTILACPSPRLLYCADICVQTPAGIMTAVACNRGHALASFLGLHAVSRLLVQALPEKPRILLRHTICAHDLEERLWTGLYVSSAAGAVCISTDLKQPAARGIFHGGNDSSAMIFWHGLKHTRSEPAGACTRYGYTREPATMFSVAPGYESCPVKTGTFVVSMHASRSAAGTGNRIRPGMPGK